MNDSRVQYWEPLKWVAKLRALRRQQRTQPKHSNVNTSSDSNEGMRAKLICSVINFSYLFIFLLLVEMERVLLLQTEMESGHAGK